MTHRLRFLVVLVTLMPAIGAAKSEQDPFEPVNRAVFGFNGVVDRTVLKPVSEVYNQVTPDPMERGVRNFFSNIGEVRNATNSLLQGKWADTATATGRFAINSTVGILGLFDVAEHIGMAQQTEDFGQTLGYWGVPSGPYLVLPVLGPSSVRDGSGQLADVWLSPLQYTELNLIERSGLATLDGLQTRADLLASEGLIGGDQYLVIREAYLSKRAYDVKDGEGVSDAFTDDEDAQSTDDDGFIDESF